MTYQSYHSLGTHKNENEIKRLIVDGCRRGICTHEGCDIPLEKRGMAGKGSHYIAQDTITALQKQTSTEEMIDRMRRRGILAKK